MAFPGKYAPFIWTLLVNIFGNNEYAAAGAMGWMYGESYLDPYTCEGDVGDESRQASHTIVQRVDNLRGASQGIFTGTNPDGTSNPLYYQTWTVNNVRYGPGFGLAQWTGVGRKTPLWKFWRKEFPNSSIGNFVMQVYFIEDEMNKSYQTCYNEMKNATSIEQAMYSWGYWYETGGDPIWTQEIVNARIGWGIQIYEMFTGKRPPVPPQPSFTKRGLKIWQMIDYNI